MLCYNKNGSVQVSDKVMKMHDLLLDSLEIRNFRAFEFLSVDKFSRVNLLTGKNNSGKTTLLEAIWLYSQGGTPSSLLTLLQVRDQFPLLVGENNHGNGTSQRNDIVEVLNLKYLFHNCDDVMKETPVLSIAPRDRPEKQLEVGIKWSDESEGKILNLAISMHNHKIIEMHLAELLESSKLIVQTFHAVKSSFVTWPHVDHNYLSKLWDQIYLSDLEAHLLTGLKMIVPNAQQVGFRGDAGISVGRIPIIKIESFTKPIPMRTLGEGVYRLFYIILTLINAKDGIVMIDEVDAGLHYSAMKGLWKLIFELAEVLNIQVFAVTHNWECIEAFTRYSESDGKSSGTLVRLSNPKGETRAVTFSGEELTTIDEQNIEVR